MIVGASLNRDPGEVDSRLDRGGSHARRVGRRAGVGAELLRVAARGAAAASRDATAKERWLRRIHDEADRDPENVYLSSHYLDSYRTRLAGLKGDAPLMESFGLRYALGLGAVRLEKSRGRRPLRGVRPARDANPKDAATWLPEALFRLGAAHFREGERRNCLARHNSDSCIFPLSARAVHVEKQGAEAARDVLERLLAIPDSDMELDAIWLLNIAHMALGTWPERSPRPTGSPRTSWRPRPPSRGSSTAPVSGDSSAATMPAAS